MTYLLIRLNVTDNLTVAGSDANFTNRRSQVEQRLNQERLQNPLQTDLVTDVIVNENSASGLFANTTPDSTGKGGSIFIDPARVTIRDGGRIVVNSDGGGNAGNITLSGGILTLDNDASISAETTTRTGGNIDIRLGDLLLLRRNSSISTSAGTAGAGGDGGNITINSPFIVAVPTENSDIRADAFQGRGGNITITSNGIFGIQQRQQNTPQTSDITASSQLGINGVVTINTPEIDPSQGIVDLPTDVVDASQLVDRSCAAFEGTDSSEFIITGRGGLPPSPDDILSNDVIWQDTFIVRNALNLPTNTTVSSSSPDGVQIVPATGWVFNDKGEVTLVAHASASGVLPANIDCFKR